MSEPKNAARQARHAAIRAEIAEEEAEATEAEAAENLATLDVSLHLRISQWLDTELRRRAAAEHIPTSALVRRMLTQAVHQPAIDIVLPDKNIAVVLDDVALTVDDVEDIARRIVREELQHM